MVKSLYEGEVHVAITRGKTDWKGKKQHLFKDPLYLVDTEIKSIEEVVETERPFIQFKSDSNYYQEIQDWWQQQFQTAPKRTIVVDQIETCKQMAFNGIGYAILPGITLTHADKEISKILLQDIEGVPLARETWLIGYDSAFKLRQVEAFHEVVNDFLEKEHKSAPFK